MWWGHAGFFPFGFFFIFVVIAAIAVSRIFAFRARGRCWRRNECHPIIEAEAILIRRLANGELNEEEYRRLREIVRK